MTDTPTRPTSPASADVADIRARCEAAYQRWCDGEDVAASRGTREPFMAGYEAALQSALAEVVTLTDQIGKLETLGLMQAHENVTLTAECERLTMMINGTEKLKGIGLNPQKAIADVARDFSKKLIVAEKQVATLTAECERLRADEREACAKVAERFGFQAPTSSWENGMSDAAQQIAAAIRARALQPAADGEAEHG